MSYNIENTLVHDLTNVLSYSPTHIRYMKLPHYYRTRIMQLLERGVGYDLAVNSTYKLYQQRFRNVIYNRDKP